MPSTKEMLLVPALVCISLLVATGVQYLAAPGYLGYPFLGASVTHDNIFAAIVEVAPEGLDNPAIENIADVTISMLENARSSVDIEFYTIYKYDYGPVEDIQRAIYNAAERGVNVRILIDNEIYSDTYFESSETRWLFDNFNAHENIEIRQSEWMMHSKTIIVDNETVLVSSANQSTSAMATSRNIAVMVKGGEFARALEAIFESGWGVESPPEFENGWTIDWIAPVVTPIGSLDWVPRTYDVIVDNLIKSATSTIRAPIYAMSGSPSQLPMAIENASEQGVDVKIIVDYEYSGLSSFPILQTLDEYPNIQVKSARLSNNGVYHSKTVVIDGSRGYVGSANWGSTSMYNRREIGVYFEDNTLASAIEEMFRDDWESRYVRFVVSQPSDLGEILIKTGLIFGILLVVTLIVMKIVRKEKKHEKTTWVGELWAGSSHEI
jgi:phosphatidylserine/phosphatidylglycerophosphate/cardiolipin synthase-like enzyme